MSDSVKVKTSVGFKPWPVPDSATLDLGVGLKQDGVKPLPTIPLNELDDDVVDALAQRWLDNLYANRAEAAPFRRDGRTRAA